MSRSTDCDHCSEWLNPLPFDEDQGQNSEPIAFSRTPCESPFQCEQGHLAGERYVVHVAHTDRSGGYMDTKRHLEHLEVCPDCYPDMAELPPLPSCEGCGGGVGLGWLAEPCFIEAGPVCPSCFDLIEFKISLAYRPSKVEAAGVDVEHLDRLLNDILRKDATDGGAGSAQDFRDMDATFEDQAAHEAALLALEEVEVKMNIDLELSTVELFNDGREVGEPEEVDV